MRVWGRNMSFKLWLILIKQSIKEVIAYRTTTFLIVFFGFLFFGIEMFSGFVYFEYTDNILGWSKLDFLSLIITATIIQYLYSFLFINSHERLADKILDGDLDFIFVRPVNSFWFYSLYRLDIPSIINVFVAVLIQSYIFSFYKLSVITILMYIIFVFLGVWFLFLINHLVIMASFWFEKADKLIGLPEYLEVMSNKPKGIYPKWIQVLLGILFPIITAINMPITILNNTFSFKLILWYIFFEILLTIVVYKVWFLGIKKYSSSN